MSEIEDIAEQLDRAWGGQTLATLREQATREFNGTALCSLRWPNGPRRILIFCLTGAHEIRMLGQLQPHTSRLFDDWARVSLFEVTVAAIASGGFAYTFEGSSLSTATTVVLVAATPDSIATLERVFQLEAYT